MEIEFNIRLDKDKDIKELTDLLNKWAKEGMKHKNRRNKNGI